MAKDSSSATDGLQQPTMLQHEERAEKRQVRVESGECRTGASTPSEYRLVHRDYDPPAHFQNVAIAPVEGAPGTEVVHHPRDRTLLALLIALPFLLVPSILGIIYWMKHRDKRQPTEHPGHELDNIVTTNNAHMENGATAIARNTELVASDAGAGHKLDGRKLNNHAEGAGAGHEFRNILWAILADRSMRRIPPETEKRH
ncbi:MAG: hypothetical protein L6R35_002129 [Caloplaca aegaea]|nr:MAG: hypothetical protein L6R35_002129 [Caloplaca aegaea]